MFSTHLKFPQTLVAFCRVALALSIPSLCLAQSATPTQTTLKLSAVSISTKATVKLAAKVTSGKTSVYPGRVLFCNADAPHCEDIAILGEAQLNPTGNAIVSLRLGVGTYNIKAVFQGVTHTSAHSATLREASSSDAQLLTVHPRTVDPALTPTKTILSSPKTSGVSHPLISSVITPGGNPVAGGTVSFVDTANGGKSLGSVDLNSSPQGIAFDISVLGMINGVYQVTSGDINRDGIPDLAFVDVWTDNQTQVLLGDGNGGFLATSPAPIPSDHPHGAITLADFNSDGILDMAVGDASPPDSSDPSYVYKVSILLGKGDGTFTPQSDFVSGKTIRSIISGDFDGDGIPDLAALNVGDSTVTVALGNGDGTFSSTRTIALDGLATPISWEDDSVVLVSADFNHDGVPDLAVTVSHPDKNGYIDLLLGAGDGNFTMTSFPVAGMRPGAMISADFNKDGLPDLAVSGTTSTVLLGDGRGGFQAAPPLPVSTGYGAVGIEVADFNRDGIPDLVLGNLMYYGKGDGTFAEIDSVFVYDVNAFVLPLSTVVWADLDGDGIPDAFSASKDVAQGMNVWLSRPNHTLSFDTTLSSEFHNIVANYSGDSSYAPSSSAPVGVWNFTANPTFIPPSGTYNEPTKVTLVDETPGAVISYSIAGGLPVIYSGPFYVNDYDGSDPGYIVSATAVAPNSDPSGLVQAKYYRKPILPMTLGIAPGNSVAVGTPVTLSAHVAGSTRVTDVVLFCDAKAAHCADSAILGSAQFVAGNVATTRLHLGVGTYSIKAVYQGNSGYASETQTLTVRGKSATITEAATAEHVKNVYSLTSQVSAFGRAEIGGTLTFKDSINGAAPVSLGSVTLSPSKTVSGLTPIGAVPTGNNPTTVASADFNRDGIPDLAVVNANDDTLSIMRGNGDGTFKEVSKISLLPYTVPTSVAAGDLNGDGFPDVAVAFKDESYLTVLSGSSNGTFTTSTPRVVFDTDYVRIANLAGGAALNLVTLNSYDGLRVGSPDNPAAYPVPAIPSQPNSVAIADFNGDGVNDIATSNTDGTVTIMLQSDAGFTVSSTLTPGGYGTVVTADFNGDGIPDLAVPGVNSIAVYLGQGYGAFSLASSPSVSNLKGLAVADFNGDGIYDLVATELVDNRLSAVIFLGAGNGTFPRSTTPVATPSVISPVVADFNSDGLPDLAALDPGSNTMGILLTNLTTAGTLEGITLSKPGTHVITTTYSGTSALAPSVGPPLTITVD